MPDTTSGTLVILSGPSGVGKGTLRQHLRRLMPDLKESVSLTTRAKRVSEVEGQDYHFVSLGTFREMITQNQLLEWEEFSGAFYGTPRQAIEEALAEGHDFLLEIDVRGALQVKAQYPQALLIFVAPPSLEFLEERLRLRNTNDEHDIQARLKRAMDELAEQPQFDIVVINDHLQTCLENLQHQIEVFHKVTL